MNKLLHSLFLYLASKLGYGIVLRHGRHFHYTEIKAHMPDEIIIYFA